MQRTCAIRQMVPKCAPNPKAFPITIQSSLAVLLASNCLHHQSLTMVQIYLIILSLLVVADNNFSCVAFSPALRPPVSIGRIPPLKSKLYTSVDVESSVQSNTNTNQQQLSQRRIAHTEKFARLPVWPGKA